MTSIEKSCPDTNSLGHNRTDCSRCRATEKPKSAEWVLTEILRLEKVEPPHLFPGMALQLLNGFVSERVQEALVKEYEGDCSNVSMIEHKAYQKGHYEALEQFDSLIQWLLGANGEFRQREKGEGAYWWRMGLAQRYRALKDTPPK